MKAKISFSYGSQIFTKGEPVPDEVAAKYPHLVEKGEGEKVVKVEEESEKVQKISTAKVQRKSNGKKEGNE